MNSKLRVILCALLVFSYPLTKAQESRYTLSGYVEDSASGERLIGATIYAVKQQKGAVTNSYGFFSITLPPDSLLLLVSYIGYKPRQMHVELNENRVLEILMDPAEYQMQPFEVTGSRMERIEARTQMSEINLPVSAIQTLPSILGETDILKIIQLLPGVKTGSEAMSGFYVRGGNPEQNLILLDEAPVYNVSHLFGFFSVFNSDAVKNVNLIKGGFPARYGSRLSSVLDINLKEGNMKEFHGVASVGLISSRITVEGPLFRNKTSYIISGRRTYFDLLAKPFMKNDEYAGYYFYDVNMKVNHIFSLSDRIYGSFYLGRDVLYVRENTYDNFHFDLDWGNITSTLRWNHIFSSKLFSNLTFIYTDYSFQVKSNTEQYNGEKYYAKYFSGIRDFGIKADLDYSPSPSHYIRFGGNFVYHLFTPDALQLKINSLEKIDTLISPSQKIHAREYAVYLEDDFEISRRIKSNLGVRASGFSVPGKFYHSVQPRITFRYLFSDDWALKGSFAAMTQYIHLLSANRIGLPNDLWVPSTKRIVPQKSVQYAAGLSHTMGEYDLSVEAYYKKMEKIIEYQEGAAFMLRSSSWEDNVETGSGKSYGIELMIQRRSGRLNGWIGYTLSRTVKLFPNLNGGREFPAKYDRRHDLAIAAVYRVNESLDLSGDWVWGTGNAITIPEGYFMVNTGTINPLSSLLLESDKMKLYSSRNGYRMDSYHRLDVSLRYTAGRNVWTFSVYNVYNRRNPFFIYFDEDFANNKITVKKVSLFPIVPSISYSYIF